jgi:hypothetical protein
VVLLLLLMHEEEEEDVLVVASLDVHEFAHHEHNAVDGGVMKDTGVEDSDDAVVAVRDHRKGNDDVPSRVEVVEEDDDDDIRS